MLFRSAKGGRLGMGGGFYDRSLAYLARRQSWRKPTLLGLALGLRIVAEGVETDTQQSFLTTLGCDALQGFLLGEPLPAEQFMADIHSAEPVGPGNKTAT